jgi:hypothetical protein
MTTSKTLVSAEDDYFITLVSAEDDYLNNTDICRR